MKKITIFAFAILAIIMLGCEKEVIKPDNALQEEIVKLDENAKRFKDEDDEFPTPVGSNITGHVTCNSQTISITIIKLYDSNSNLISSTYPDVNGDYTFTNLDLGLYTVVRIENGSIIATYNDIVIE